MPELTDQELLRAFVERRDEQAFEQIVGRYLDVVYATARRQPAGAQLADDVTQAVFIVLAKKASSIRDASSLAGWLVNTARLVAKTAKRTELRLKQRERRVAEMTDSPANTLGPSDQLDKFDANLDDALARLSDQDRTVITLRYLQDKPVREVAALLGTSEDAAAKRISRAVQKLRGLLAAGGVTGAASGWMTDALLRQAQIAAPPHLTAHATASAALHGGAAAGTGAAAAVLAHAFISAAMWKTIVAVAAALFFAAALGSAGFFAIRAARSAEVRAAVVAPPAPAWVNVTRNIKVGVYVSFNTATKDHTDDARGWEQLRAVDELRPAADLDLYPLIEPGSEKDPQLALKLKQYFAGKAPTDVTDIAAIEQMDVLLAASAHYAPESAVNALETAVRDGRGMVVRQCLGGDNNGYTRSAVRHMRFFDEADADALNTAGSNHAVVVASHVLLGTLSGHLDVLIPAKPYGGYGKLMEGALPLLEVRGVEKLVYEGDKSPVREHAGYGVYPLAVGRLGKGRLVSCSFPPMKVPPELMQATNDEFGIRLIRWAAGKDDVADPK